MHKYAKLFAYCGLVFTLLLSAGCSAQPTPPPTETSQPPATEAPSDTPAPTSAPTATKISATATQKVSGTQSGAGTQAAATVSAGTPAGGATSAPPPPSSVDDKAQYLSQNIADGTRVKPGTPMTIVWSVKNIGKTEWNTNYILRYFAGLKAAGTTYPFSKKVAPGGTIELSLSIVAPTEAGTYNTWWKLTNDKNQNFSDVNFEFEVSSNPGAPAATPTKKP